MCVVGCVFLIASLLDHVDAQPLLRRCTQHGPRKSTARARFRVISTMCEKKRSDLLMHACTCVDQAYRSGGVFGCSDATMALARCNHRAWSSRSGVDPSREANKSTDVARNNSAPAGCTAAWPRPSPVSPSPPPFVEPLGADGTLRRVSSSNSARSAAAALSRAT